jgi:phosphatidate cytidylyltransferase
LITSFYTIYELIDFGGNYLYFLLITLICVSTDIGGYIFGKIFKGPKITKISPKKTYAGMIGGYFLSILFVNVFFNISYLFPNKTEISTDIFVFVLLISTINQLGDMIISYFKRLSKIKDTGKIIPGHGGLLDRVDGMIFAFPFSYLIMSTNTIKLI